MTRRDTPEQVKKWFQEAVRALWPVAIGSLSLRRSPCICEHCRLCKSDEGHPNYALYGRQGKRCFSIYVPDELAPELERAIRKGRQVHELMVEAGREYALALKNERRSRQG